MTESSATPVPAFASDPGGFGLPKPVRPTTVTLAFYAWLVMTALSLVSLIIVLTSPIWDQAVAAGLQAVDTNGVRIDAQTLVNTAKITSVVGFLIGAALYLLFAFKMHAGRNWARIVLTIIGVLGVLSAVLPTYRSVTVNGSTFVVQNYGIHWISLALLVVALVLMFHACVQHLLHRVEGLPAVASLNELVGEIRLPGDPVELLLIMANPGWDQNNNPYGAQPPAGGQGGYSPPPSYPPPSYPPPGGQGGYPGAPGGYPPPYPGGPQGYSAYPGGAGLPPEPVRPMTVTLAFYDWILMVVISAISVILVLTSSVWDQAVAAGAASSGSGSISIDVNSLVTTVKVITVVIFLVFAALYLFFAFKMNAGRNWARIVLTVVGALAVLSGFSATSTVTVNGQSYSANNQVFGWIGALLAVVAIVLMFLPQSNAYFTASKAHRQALR